MRKLMLVVCLSFCCIFMSAQKQDSDLNKMLDKSISLFIEYNDGVYQSTPIGNGEYNPYICVDNYPFSYSFPEDVKNRHMRYMTFRNISDNKEFRKKKNFEFIFMEMELVRNRLVITLSNRSLTLPKNSHAQIKINDWVIFTYEYSEKKKEWELKQVNYGNT